MQSSYPTEQEILKALLEPLLTDFQYWFERSHSLLTRERISFLSSQEQTELLNKIKTVQKEVNSAKILFKATDGVAGIDTAVLASWHRLMAQCWNVARRWRYLKQEEKEKDNYNS